MYAAASLTTTLRGTAVNVRGIIASARKSLLNEIWHSKNLRRKRAFESNVFRLLMIGFVEYRFFYVHMLQLSVI